MIKFKVEQSPSEDAGKIKLIVYASTDNFTGPQTFNCAFEIDIQHIASAIESALMSLLEKFFVYKFL